MKGRWGEGGTSRSGNSVRAASMSFSCLGRGAMIDKGDHCTTVGVIIHKPTIKVVHKGTTELVVDSMHE